jgi:hypothetical protein
MQIPRLLSKLMPRLGGYMHPYRTEAAMNKAKPKRL